MTVTRHFDRAEASGEIPKSYALTRGDFDAIDAERVTIRYSVALLLTTTLRMTVTTNPPLGRGNKRGWVTSSIFFIIVYTKNIRGVNVKNSANFCKGI